ncbi:alpha-dioxygenase 2-like [Actinia tenebrosa]|uniref:Alpha-dioxygenase 2-like n=1 Tax=Actinia tenebrosa TaxID=6105 RepID=A0A6P8I6J0_ACTTE|nr:alpha-dioxygenase 2-like [Actinia tenebrosa]
MKDGKLKVDDEGFIPTDPKTRIEITGFSNNWWVGLSLLHNAFTHEHNSVCDMLKNKHPSWSDQKIYDTARLIISALIAKIHVVEWTPTILNEKFVKYAVDVEWFGKLAPEVLSALMKNNVTLDPGSVKANIGNPRNFGKNNVPFSLTEEFVAVYRFHSLLPDQIHIRSMDTGAKTGKVYTLPEVTFGKVADVFDQNDIKDILYTFGTENPGQLVLNNYPVTTSDLVIPKHQGGGGLIDLATIDIIRDRERGIPRYNKFRHLLGLQPLVNFTQFDVSPEQVQKLKNIYNNDINQVDLLVGSLAERRPPGFGFGETPFVLFLLMANRRMLTDRFLTDDFKAEYYTQEGIDWVSTQTMKDVLLRAFSHVPKLVDAMKDAETVFFDWKAEK